MYIKALQIMNSTVLVHRDDFVKTAVILVWIYMQSLITAHFLIKRAVPYTEKKDRKENSPWVLFIEDGSGYGSNSHERVWDLVIKADTWVHIFRNIEFKII